VRPSLEQPALYQRVNVEGTVNLLEAARLNRVRKVIIASSSSVYGVNSKVPFAESDPIFRAISPYAASKLACEALGHVYHHVYGLDIVMLRFFTVYGPRQRPDLAIHKFARLISLGAPIPVFGDGTAARDHTYVSDILEGVMACTQQEFGFEIYNLGESQTVRLDRLIALLEEALGRKAVIERLPPQPGDAKGRVAAAERQTATLAPGQSHTFTTAVPLAGVGTHDEFADVKAGHDGLARAGVVRQDEPQRLARQHGFIDRRDLVGQRLHVGRVNGHHGIEQKGEVNALGLDHELESLAEHLASFAVAVE